MKELSSTFNFFSNETQPGGLQGQHSREGFKECRTLQEKEWKRSLNRKLL